MLSGIEIFKFFVSDHLNAFCDTLNNSNLCAFLYKCGTMSLLNPIRPGLFSRSPGPGGGLRGPDAKNRG